MATIRILPPEVASQIAAGEVVERPSSVVKELLENALDAGARRISITTKGAGQQLIEVADDGNGIPAEELAVAVARHATSKLSSAADLTHILTLGFRGEALASIGSVSILTITSRPAEVEAGARLRVEGGRLGDVHPVGSPAGTMMRVENLFYNVPARMKFLKKEGTERGLIDDLVTRYALAYPNVRFQLSQEGRPVLQTSGNGNAREVLAALYGVDVAKQMLEVLAEEENLHITGYVTPISITRANRREITFFVNGRPVQDSRLTAAVTQAYQNLLMVGRFPMAVLFLKMDPEVVDVNVHPAKAEVRFRDQDRVFSGVHRAVRRALLAHTPVPGMDADAFPTPQWGFDAPALNSDGPPGSSGEHTPFDNPQPEASVVRTEDLNSHSSIPLESSLGGASSPALPVHSMGLLRLIGQVAATYLVAEGPDGLYLIDQHAAHERILFERFMQQRSQEIPSQSLIPAVPVDMPPASARLLAEQIPVLSRFGFQVEPFGPTTFLVRAIPSILTDSDPGAALRVIVEDFEEDETPLQNEIEAKIIARVCKRAAVKAGHKLSPEEQHALLLELEKCQSPRTCPHGRPTMIHISVDLLERQFGRKGAR